MAKQERTHELIGTTPDRQRDARHTVRGILAGTMWASFGMISDTRTRQPRDGTMQCGNQPADISVIHRRFKAAARRVAHPVRTTLGTYGRRKYVKKIARISPAPVDKVGPYQYFGTVMLTRHTAWGDSEAGRQRKGSSWRPASESPQAVRIGPRYITAQDVLHHRVRSGFGALGEVV